MTLLRTELNNMSVAHQTHTDHFSFSASFNKMVERKKLVLRANKYRNKEDRGGITYLLNSIQRGDTVFDIGAHKAGYLYFMRQQVGNKGRVFAFEPQQLLYEYLRRTKQMFEWNNVTVEYFAVSASDGEATLFIPYNNGRQSSPGATIMENIHPLSIQREEMVTTISLDMYCVAHGLAPDFLKIDVEGNELNIFKGATHLLQYRKPRILVECEARHVGKDKLFETIAYLERFGYRGHFVCDDTILPVKQFSLEIHQSPEAKVYCNNFIFE